MSMEKINGSALQHSGLLDSSQQQDRVEKKKAAEANAMGAGGGLTAPAKGDTAEISDKAHQLVALRHALDAGESAVAQLPDLRQEKLALARQRLADGHYNSREVRDAVSGRLVSAFESLID